MARMRKAFPSHVACDAVANRTPSRRQMQNRGKLALPHASPSCRDQSHKVRYNAGLAAVAAERSFPGNPTYQSGFLAVLRRCRVDSMQLMCHETLGLLPLCVRERAKQFIFSFESVGKCLHFANCNLDFVI